MVIYNEEIVESDVIRNHLAVHSSDNKETNNRTFTLPLLVVDDGSSQNTTRLWSNQSSYNKNKNNNHYNSNTLNSKPRAAEFHVLQQPLCSTLRGNETGVTYRSDSVTPLFSSVVNPYVSAHSSNCMCNLNYNTKFSRDLSVLRSKMKGRVGADILDTALHCFRKVDLSDDDFDNLWKSCQVLKLDECLFFGVLEIAQAEK